MSNLHEQLIETIDQAEADLRAMEKTPGLGVSEVDGCTCYGGSLPEGHEPGCGLEPGPVWTLINSALRGLAEDRDILRRHAPCDEEIIGPLGTFGIQTVCMNCSDLDQDFQRVVLWPCNDALSLARRHGLETT
jgi:hypothetical protein